MTKKAASKRNEQATTALGGILGIVLAYAFISRAFSTGSYWQYALSIIFFVLGAKLLMRTFKHLYGNND